MANILTELIGFALEYEYTKIAAEPVTAGNIGTRILLVKGISQDEGSAAAVAFLTAHDTSLGPFAQQVVDAVNAKTVAQAIPEVLAIVGLAEAESAPTTP